MKSPRVCSAPFTMCAAGTCTHPPATSDAPHHARRVRVGQMVLGVDGGAGHDDLRMTSGARSAPSRRYDERRAVNSTPAANSCPAHGGQVVDAPRVIVRRAVT